LRPSLRRPPQSILGENTPPQSATMLALQTMSARDVDAPLSNVTNGSNALVRTPQTFDAISNQILSLTSIATSLQREMAQLSRRSKDNATDLVSLKEATNARDEDIRKSLRDLVSNLSESGSRLPSGVYGSGSYMLDNKPHSSSPRGLNTISLPRFPTPDGFSVSMDSESTSSPMAYNAGGAAAITLLEKILGEMGTKEGQNHLVSRLTDVADRLARDGVSTAKKLEDLVQFIKINQGSQALVTHQGGGNRNGTGRNRNLSFGEAPKLELNFDQTRNGPMVNRVEQLLGDAGNKENRRDSGPSRAADLINEDILKIIRTVKDSVAQGGGLTAEVKALVRELRGEVLGMGREIGRKLDQVSGKSLNSRDASLDRENISQVIHDGLEELKSHMDRVMRDSRRQSSSSTVSRTTIDGQEVYNAVKAAMAEMQTVQTRSMDSQESALGKDDIVEAVREAWENYKPEIEHQHFGLEREELLATLKEGIQEYAPHDGNREIGATREEVFAAVVEGMKHFSPPNVETEASLSREEILDAVRECLEEFEFPSAPSTMARDIDITKDEMVDAVKEGLSSFDFPNNSSAISRDVGSLVNREDLFEAVKSGLEEMDPMTEYGEKIQERLQEVIEVIRVEFQAVSDEAKQNVSANGRDTEQVLDATKDGLEKLRADIETYIDRATGFNDKQEFLDDLRDSFDTLRAEVGLLVAKESDGSLNSVKNELERLRESMVSSVVPSGSAVDREEIVAALRDGLDGLRADLERPRDGNESVLSGTGEILDALHDGLRDLRSDVEKVGSKPVDMTVSYEILDALKAGIESVRADIDRLRENGQREHEVTAIANGAVITADNMPAEGLKRNDIENLEVLITQLRIKVESLESMPPPPMPAPGSLSRDDLANIEEALRQVQDSISDMSGRDPSVDGNSAKREDFEAIETLLRNTKAKIDDLDPEQVVKKDHLDIVEGVVRETRDTLNELGSQIGETSKRDDVLILESLIKDIIVGLDEVKEHVANDVENVERVTKTDVEAVEAVCLDVKTQLMQMASKEDVLNLEEVVKEFKDRIETHAESNSKAFEERQAETVGVGERVSEIKTFLEEFKDAIKERFDDGSTSIDALGKLLDGVSEAIDVNANNHESIKELFDTVKDEFEKSNAGVVGAKLESDEKFQKTWDKFDDKIEEKFNEIMLKYDDAQMAADAKMKLGDETMLGTKVIAEELKILIDTLGSTLTESADKMDESSKTVFNRVEDTFTRVEETHADAKAEHQLTREQVFKTLSAIEGVQEHAGEYQPKILDSIKDVLLIVGQHYEHSKTSAESIQEKISERPIASPPSDHQPLLKEAPVSEKHDDTQVNEKLDKLVDHMHAAGKSFAQLDMLDKIHQQVMDTAAEVSQFVAAQTQRISTDHEDREKAVEAATIALEKKITQKDHIEAGVVSLREEEDRLKESILAMKAEKEDLAHQKMRLTADVSSLETALRIRQEELHAMESRAEGLERRILEGVIDHSRAFLLNKSNKGRDAMNLKRVPSHATSTAGSVMSSSTVRTGASYTTQNAVEMAMNGNRAMLNVPINNPAGASRRILSLNQITNNVPNGGFKRSHSVKAPSGGGALRKSSWGGSLNRKEYGDLNKENLAIRESQEDWDNLSDAGTMRKTSGYGTVTGTEMSESIDEGTEYSGGDEETDTPADGEGGNLVLFEEAGQVV
jgi:chromosome segregation ATPase